MTNPPAELFKNIPEEELLQQFLRLRSWVQSLEKEAYGHEFYEPKSCLVKAVNAPDNMPFRVSANNMPWPSHLGAPLEPTIASEGFIVKVWEG